MNHKNLFETFSNRGKLLLSDQNILFQDIPWSKHPEFEGVELKHSRTDRRTIQLSLSTHRSKQKNREPHTYRTNRNT